MWARIIEFMLVLWLALSPFIFRYPPQQTFLWKSDFICAFLVALFALVSFWNPLKRMHLLTIGVALWLWGSGYMAFPDKASLSEQNGVVIGIILSMLAIVPSHSSRVSPSWERFIEKISRE